MLSHANRREGEPRNDTKMRGVAMERDPKTIPTAQQGSLEMRNKTIAEAERGVEKEGSGDMDRKEPRGKREQNTWKCGIQPPQEGSRILGNAENNRR